jgi:hypothetical protein
MKDAAKYLYLAIVVLALPVWIAAVWTYIKMLRYARFGNVWAILFNSLWWTRGSAERLLTPKGLVYHRRAVWLVAAFLLLVFAGLVTGIAIAIL